MLGSGPEPDDSGFLWTKVSQLRLSSKSGRSERPFALILGSQGGGDGLSRAFFARRQRTLDRPQALPYSRLGGRRAYTRVFVQTPLVFGPRARYAAAFRYNRAANIPVSPLRPPGSRTPPC